MSSHARPSRHAHGKWEGFDALHAALQGLASAKGTSQNRIGAVAKLALQYAKFYKHVVHDVEVFLWKAEPEHRLAGLYAIDAIVRQGGARADAREQYVKRFAIRLSDTLNAVKAAPADSQSKVRQVIEEWQRRGIYSTSAIEAAGGCEFALRDEDPSRHGQERYNPTHSSTTPTSSSGKLASLLSIIKKKKEQEHDHTSTVTADQRYQPGHGDRQLSYDAYDQRDNSPQVVSPYGQQGRHFQDQASGELRGQRATQGIMGDAPPSLLGAGPPRAAPSDDRSNEWNDDSGRSVKKQRSSRWGPPKPAGEASTDNRPPPIVTSAPMSSTDNHSRPSGDVGFRESPPRVDSRVSPSFHNAQDVFRPPSSDGRGPDSYGRYDGAPSQPPRHNGPDGLVNHGFNSRPEDNRFMPGSGPNPAGPSPRFADRPSPHQPQQNTQLTGNQQPGGSGEICRKFLAGRCTFGDRCWHVHDPQTARPPPPPPVATEAKRKTVLCKNFPLGRCRYGDKCSFAHGVEDLGSTRPQIPPPTGWNGFSESPRGRWDPASGTPPVAVGNPAPGSYPVHPSSSAPPTGFPPQHLPRQNGAGVPPQAVFNEPQDGRGTAGATPISNGGNIGSGAPPSAPPHPMRLQGPAAQYGAGGPPGLKPTTYAQGPRAASYTGPPAPPIRMDAGRSGVPQHAYLAAEKTVGIAGAKPHQVSAAAARLDDDEEPEAPVEEFTLQYDEED